MARTSGHGHLKHLLSSIRFLHLALGINFPGSFQLDMTMQGLKRKLARVPFQVLPITPRVLRDMYKFLDMSKNSDLALWCSFLTSFFGLLRKSNAVPDKTDFNPNKVLVRRNLSVDLSTNMVYMYLDPVLDLVCHLHALFSRVQAHADAPAFSFGPSSTVTYSTYTSRLKTLLTKAGYDAALYSGHSFRRGGATFLHACGGTALMVQASGDWSSQCFTRYLYLSFAERLRSQSLISVGINATAG